MDESFGGMLKFTIPKDSIWKSKMSDWKDLTLLVQFHTSQLENVDGRTWEVMHVIYTMFS